VRETIETYIRADASDATAIANISEQPGSPTDYASEPIGVKVSALKVVNLRINHLGIDQPIAVDLRTIED